MKTLLTNEHTNSISNIRCTFITLCILTVGVDKWDSLYTTAHVHSDTCKTCVYSGYLMQEVVFDKNQLIFHIITNYMNKFIIEQHNKKDL